MGFIYMLTFPSEKSYIGQTIQTIEKRFQAHQYASSNCVAVYNAIEKYGWENVKKDWYEVPDEELNNHEELMIEVLGTLVPSGYNLREGGGSTGKLSEETKKKISDALSGEKNPMYGKTGEKHPMFEKEHTEESKQKMSEAKSGEKAYWYGKTGERHNMFGKTRTKETKQKISESTSGEKNHMFGKEHTEETKQKQREAKIGKTHTTDAKQKISEAMSGDKNHNSKKMYKYNLDGTYVGSYGSSGEAAQSLGKTDGSLIKRCARGKRPSAYGFKWSREKL